MSFDAHNWELLEKQRARLELLLVKNDTWEDLLTYLSWALTPAPAIQTKDARHAVVWGENDGTLGLEDAIALMRANPAATLILSGGVYGREQTTSDMGALDMYATYRERMLKEGTDETAIKERVIIESSSLHTGHQRELISPLLAALKSERISFIEPFYHMPRFALSLGEGFNDHGYRPAVLPVPFGEATTPHPMKGPLNAPAEQTFTYEELLCLPPTPSRATDTVKSEDCGELDKILAYQATNPAQCLSFKEALAWFRIASSTE
ncbi:MAG: ElyC/SanA/YdcF family protein [Candidatus Spechtbacterales bacterium]